MKSILSMLCLCGVLLFVSSCDKDEGKSPNIAFKTGANYTSASKIVALGDSVLVGISASKSEDKDVLKTFDVSRSYDGGANVSVLNQTLTGAEADAFEGDITITARNTPGTEKYLFTVINRDGLKNTIDLTLTVQ